MKKFKDLRKDLGEEIQFKVDVEGMPPTFMNGRSSAEILAKLRKIVKQPSMIKSVERQTDIEVKKAYRKRAQGRDVDEASVVPSADGKSLVPMKKASEPKSKPVPNSQFGLPRLKKTNEEAKYDYGTPESVKSMKKTTPGQNEQMLPTTAQKRMNRALKKHGVGKNDDYYLSKLSPEKRKKYEPQKFERKPVSVDPPKHKPFQWIKTK